MQLFCLTNKCNPLNRDTNYKNMFIVLWNIFPLNFLSQEYEFERNRMS